MCFEPLQKPDEQAAPAAVVETVAEVAVTATDADPAPAPPAGAERALTASEAPASGPGTWTCRACETENSVAVDACSVCGTTIYRTMGADTNEITLSQDQGLRLALVPGLAHARLGDPVMGFIVGILVLACIGFSLLFITGGGPVWGLIGGLVGILTWAVSIFDVNQRIAGNAPILRPRVMTILGGVVIVVIMVAGFIAGATAVRSPGS